MKSIFISRSVNPDETVYKSLKEKGKVIFDFPLINIVKIPFSYTPQTNWIFFTSKNAIKYFFEQNPTIPENVKYGVISESSETTLRTFGKKADFTGRGTDLNNIAREFRNVVGNDSILFPQAMDSLQTIQKQLSFTNTVYNLYTYKTILKTDFELPYTDVVIFTSPSNVKAYFSKYRTDPRQLIIAMGTSTKYALSEYGVKDVLIPREFSENGLFDIVAEKS